MQSETDKACAAINDIRPAPATVAQKQARLQMSQSNPNLGPSEQQWTKMPKPPSGRSGRERGRAPTGLQARVSSAQPKTTLWGLSMQRRCRGCLFETVERNFQPLALADPRVPRDPPSGAGCKSAVHSQNHTGQLPCAYLTPTLSKRWPRGRGREHAPPLPSKGG